MSRKLLNDLDGQLARPVGDGRAAEVMQSAFCDACSTANNGVSTAIIQRLPEYSSPDLTNKVYTNVDPVLRQAVDRIPAGEWLQWAGRRFIWPYDTPRRKKTLKNDAHLLQYTLCEQVKSHYRAIWRLQVLGICHQS
jgi:hypothetical protein